MPERLLTEREMIDVLTDVQIIEADINYQKRNETKTRKIQLKSCRKTMPR